MKYFFPIIMVLGICLPAAAQWTNRYPKVEGYGHHVYLEAFELPIMNAGPTDPAPSPDGEEVAFAAKGYLWLMDLKRREAQRLTFSPFMDGRPNWSPDGKEIVFVRDLGTNTQIMLLDLESGKEQILIETPALDLDPVFSSDSRYVYYASAVEGSIDIWRLELSTGIRERITKDGSLERLPLPFGTQDRILFLRKEGFSYDSFVLMDLNSGSTRTIASDNFISQATFTLSPDERTLAYTWPHIDRYELLLLDLNVPSNTMVLTQSEGLPLTPKFSADGQWIYYSEPNKSERHQLKRIRVTGGQPEILKVEKWDWGEPTQSVSIYSKINGDSAQVRMHVVNSKGHAFIPEDGIVHSDGQSGRIFFYSGGHVELQLPYGDYIVTAVQGFTTPLKSVEFSVGGSSANRVEINLERLWEPRQAGWFAGDNHFHLNYGGTYRLDPEDILLDLKGEGIDIAWPLLANLHNRFLDQSLWGWENEEPPLIRFGHEVRSHFLGHVNLLGIGKLYWPWIWGPRYDLYGRDDRLNAEPLDFANRQGGLGGYVHPVGDRDPFTPEGATAVPIELVADYVLGKGDILEVACLWTDEIGTADLWHELLNLGRAVAPSAGADVMNDYFRTMAIGASRVYVKPDGPLTEENYLEALGAGRSFVSTGPLMDFDVAGEGPGGIIRSKDRRLNWSLTVHSPVPYEKVEIFVNGDIVWRSPGMEMAGSREYSGFINVPEGGWVTARVHGGSSIWPMMDSYPFAETGPIWFGEAGSTTPEAKKRAAEKLLNVLRVSETRLKAGYGDHPIPRLVDHFEKARQYLQQIIHE